MGTRKPGWSESSLLCHLFRCMAAAVCVYPVGKDSLNFFEYLNAIFYLYLFASFLLYLHFYQFM